MLDRDDELEPIFSSSSWLSGRGLWSGTFTKTGVFWIFIPWYLVLKHGIKFSLMHLSLFIIFLGISLGFISTGVIYREYSALICIGMLYAVVHTHCMSFTFALYSMARGSLSYRVELIFLIVSSFIPLVIWSIAGMYLNMILRV